MAQVTLDRLTKQYGSVPAVSVMDLHVRDRELLVLVGPSGCGKTTTLRLIAGLEEVTSGQVRIGDRVVNQLAPKDRNVAMVFQQAALYPHLNVYQNLAFGLKLRRVPRGEIDRRVRQAASLLGLEMLLERRAWQLSGGQRQRVAVGRAIVRPADVFLFDEPLSHLDAQHRVTMRAELARLQEQLATTTIHVTHDQVEAMTMGHRIAVMCSGRMQQVGTPLEVYESPANRFVAEFIGSPPMRFLTGALRVEGGDVRVDLPTGSLPLPPGHLDRYGAWHGRQVLLGLRAEAVRDVPPAQSEGLWQAWRAKVTLVQPLGAETILDLASGGCSLLARVAAHRGYARGEEIDVYVNAAGCHLFDPATGVRL